MTPPPLPPEREQGGPILPPETLAELERLMTMGVPIPPRQGLALLAHATALARQQNKLVLLVANGYTAANRTGWEDGPTTAEWCQAALDMLAECGIEHHPSTPEGKAELAALATAPAAGEGVGRGE